MGNVASCAPSIISNGAVKVVGINGRLSIYPRAVKVAELMLENPGQFVCDSCNLKVGQRIPGLSADEELEMKQIYYLLPMEMLYSVLTSEEQRSLNDVSSKALRQGSLNFSKILPVLGDFCLFPNAESKKLGSAIKGSAEPEERYSRQRSWKPALETIMEAPTPPYV